MSAVGGNTVFAVPIFFIAFREALEASLVIGILIASLESLVRDHLKPSKSSSSGQSSSDGASTGDADSEAASASEAETQKATRALIGKLRKAVFFGALTGLLIAFAIGAAFLAVFYTQVNNLYGKAEELWEGIFNLVAVCLIVPMSIAILKSERAKDKWKRKLGKAFEGRFANKDAPVAEITAQESSEKKGSDSSNVSPVAELAHSSGETAEDTTSRGAPKTGLFARIFRRGSIWRSKPTWIVFSIPLVTTLREGLEGVVFIGGVSLGLPATSIPLPAILGLAVGFGIGVLVWRGGMFVGKIRFFILFATCALLIIAAGMFSRSVFYLEFYRYVQYVGDSAAESGAGAGSYPPWSTIAHFEYGNPENNSGGSGWGILNSLTGYNNTWTYGSTLAYALYWIAIAGYMLYSLRKEGRLGRRTKKAPAPSEA